MWRGNDEAFDSSGIITGIPPQVWGELESYIRGQMDGGYTPAGTGRSSSCPGMLKPQWVYPRRYGAIRPFTFIVMGTLGIPP